MTEIQRAIKSAQERLETDKEQELQSQIYEFLKEELNTIEGIDKDIKTLQEKKRIHEENIKNLKSGNLEAIEKRRQAVNGTWFTFTTTSSTSPLYFYNTNVAGFTYKSPLTGRTYIF